MKRFKRGFTLAEVLITLAIIGVVAAISIPSVISNTQQQEFKTGLRKAVSVLNSAITMNMALDGETPYDNKNTVEFLKKHLSVQAKTNQFFRSWTCLENGQCFNETNKAFYTTDGMRFEYPYMKGSEGRPINSLKLHESDVYACVVSDTVLEPSHSRCDGCGSYGLKNNPNNTTKPPCAILVDVNGDRKPNPANVYHGTEEAFVYNKYRYTKWNEKKLYDIFNILITDQGAIPYGVAAQKAMYDAQK